MSTIHWTQLGSPTSPGDVRVQGVGIVVVTQTNIDDVKSVGGSAGFELIDATSVGDKMRKYLLGLMV